MDATQIGRLLRALLYCAVALFAVMAAVPVPGADIQACFSPPMAGGCDPLSSVLHAIGGAHKTIRIQIYSLTLQEIVSALVTAKRRGVDVRVIVDSGQLKEDHSDKLRVASLASSGVPVLVDTVPGLMHDKVMVIDGETVLTGSFNYTWGAEGPSGAVIGNRRSMIYQWPGCRYYDKISPRNRVEFPSAAAAQAAGYRSANNCR